MAPTQGYPIPAGEARVELRVANSRFIATAGPAATVDEARAFIARVREEFADATHNVFAFVVGHGASTTLGMSDDGEPAGTAGRPALAVVQGSGLGDVVVVVTRYFGGTLLGTGGLVRAYGDAVRAVLAALPRAEKVERRAIGVTVTYAAYQATRRLVDAHRGAVLDERFAAEVTLQLSFAANDLEPFVQALRDLTAGRARVQPLPAHERS
ncbi:YigZ family protein [Kallotenue papyrolyticum]|uniref:YigZ family protein n=1 Tax=Kallotenue papyrolyticum TaxID=1325125 RepID=UPI000492484C|nr:YigZ family protein [Kallotenue papyrolyticum]